MKLLFFKLFFSLSFLMEQIFNFNKSPFLNFKLKKKKGISNMEKKMPFSIFPFSCQKKKDIRPIFLCNCKYVPQ